MLINRLVLFLCIVSILSCSKGNDQNPVPLNQRISKIIIKNLDSVDITRLIYDSSGKLTQVTDSNNNNQPTQYINIFYTPAGKLSKMIYYHNNLPPDRIDTFLINSSGQVTGRNIKFTNAGTRSVVYVYDASGRLIADSSFSGSSMTYTVYNYSNGDLVEWKGYGPSPFTGITSLLGTVKTTFNSSPNVFKKLGMIYFFAKMERIILSDHQRVTQKITPGDSTQYFYEYFPSGDVKKIQILYGTSSGPGESVEFVYQ